MGGLSLCFFDCRVVYDSFCGVFLFFSLGGRSRVVVVVVFVVVVLLVIIVVSICFRTTDKHSIVNNNTQFVVLRVVFCFVFFFPSGVLVMDLLCESGRRCSGRITTTFVVLRILEEESSEWRSLAAFLLSVDPWRTSSVRT